MYFIFYSSSDSVKAVLNSLLAFEVFFPSNLYTTVSLKLFDHLIFLNYDSNS